MSQKSWRIAGVLTLAHVVLMLVGFSFEGNLAMLTDGPESAKSAIASLNIGQTMAGGYVEILGFFAFLASAAFLSRVLGRASESGRWLSQTAWGSALVYVAVTLSPGMAAGAAAVYGATHGASLDAAMLVNNLRNFTFFISLLPLGVFTCAVGALAVTGGSALPRWIGWLGLPVGIAQFVGTAGAAAEWTDYASMLWLVWFVALGITMIARRAPKPAAQSIPQPAMA
jgi:hypothetical protein